MAAAVAGGPVVARGRRGLSEAANDRALMWWVGRFRFVTPRELAMRFEVTEQRVNVRVRRLLDAGLLGGMRNHLNDRRLVFLTRRGSLELGLGGRRPPRTDVQIRHELAIVTLVAETERRDADARLMTERECRRAERETGQRWSADVHYQGRIQKRWPDIVEVASDGRRRAIELELTAKHTPRLEAIVNAYRYGSMFDEVLWLTNNAPLARRLEGLCGHGHGQSATVMLVDLDERHRER